MLVPEARYRDRTQITDAMITGYYQQHSKEFQAPEKVSVQYITLSLAKIMAQYPVKPISD